MTEISLIVTLNNQFISTQLLARRDGAFILHMYIHCGHIHCDKLQGKVKELTLWKLIKKISLFADEIEKSK